MHGIHAVVVDISDAAIRQAEAEVLEKHPLRAAYSPKACLASRRKKLPRRMTFTRDLKDLTGCEMIIENVPERWEIKRPIYEQLDALHAARTCASEPILRASQSRASRGRPAGRPRSSDSIS